jgi:maleate cis-trans isomerase
MMRLGIIYPGGGAEQDYYLFGERHGLRMFLVGSRIPAGDDHAVDALLQTARIENLLEAVGRFRTLDPDAVVWACTSGSFIVGRDGAERQVAALRAATGVPATSTSLAFVDALDALNARLVAVVATYPEPASRALASFLNAFGVIVASLQWLDAPSGLDAALISEERLAEAVRHAAAERPDAVLIPDTALTTMERISRLESIAQCAVLTANQVTLWAALGLAGRPLVTEGYGRLFNLPFRDYVA